MDWDEVLPLKKSSQQITLGETLATMSVSDLEARIAALATEIDRVRSEINAKKAQQQAAAAFFKS